MSRRTKENSQEAILNKLLSEPGNEVCADCGTRSPRWASVTLGVFLCIRCAGIHRQIGVHVTLVKSVNLDTWKPEQIQKCVSMGNLKAAQIYEANVPAGARPNPNDQYAVEQWIRAKYERKLYMAAAGAPSPAPAPSSVAREKREERYGRSVTVSQSPSPTSRRLATSTTTTATATAPHSAPVHRRSSSTATTAAAAAPSPAPTVDFFSLESTMPPTPSTTPTPTTASTTHHHQRTPSLPMHLDSYSMPNLSLFSSMTATPSPPLHHQPPSPAAVAPPADLFAGLSLGSAPTRSPLPAAADAGRSYDSAKADIMQLFQPAAPPATAAAAFYQPPAVLPSPHMAMQHPGTPYVYHQAQPYGYPAVATTGQFYSGLR